MTNRLDENVLKGVAANANTNTISVCMILLYCMNDDYEENKEFLTGRGANLGQLRLDLIEQVIKEEADFQVLDELSALGRVQKKAMESMLLATPDLKKCLDRAKKYGTDEQRETYFEDFLNAIYELTTKDSFARFILDKSGYKHNPNGSGSGVKSKYKTIAELCTNLNDLAKNKKIDPLIGRRDEVQRVVEVLAHYKKKNPLLVGEPGVGKTAVAEGLASLIEQGQVPAALKNSIIFSLEVSTIVAGTKFRGEFEQRMKDLVKELKKMKEKEGVNPILFIDEIHQIIGAGAGGQGQGTTDMSNILKPALANGDISLIGSTTEKEYKAHISKDTALDRRLQLVKILEPSDAETLRILKQGVAPVLAKYHGVKFPDEVLERAVDLSSKYLTNKHQPDKAISLIDSVGARLRTNDSSSRRTANIDDVEKIISKMTGTPVSAFKKQTGKSNYVDLAKEIKKAVFGQDGAIDAVTDIYELSKAGLAEEGQPIGSLLFVGPTGVGKTEVAKQLADKTNSHFMKINMGEYSEEHSVAKLLGAPPGYEGHKEGGILTNEVTKFPHTVLLLDEIEKAHKKVFDSLLGIIDGASMTDGEGNRVDFTNVLVIMTSNAGASIAANTKGPMGLISGPQVIKEVKVKVSEEVLKGTFSPEFRNKLSAIVHFQPLDNSIIDKVTSKFLQVSIDKLQQKKGITLEFDKNIKDYISKTGFDPAFGARPIKRLIQEEIDKKLVKPILKAEIKAGDVVKFTLKDDKILFEVIKPVALVVEEVAIASDKEDGSV